jgi:plastocyanin
VPWLVACLLGCSTSPTQPGPGSDGATALDGRTGADLGAAEDAPPPVDVGADGGSAGEAGPACASDFAGCVTFTDATAPDADRTIAFQDYNYAPQCLMVRAGQTVTFAGDFIRHPLTPSCGPELVLENRDSRPSAAFVLASVGVYGYYCLDHGNAQGQAMAGAIEVIP